MDNRPLPVRAVDKKWSTRNQAYVEMVDFFRNCLDDSMFDDFAPIMGQIASDSHANAFDTGLGAILEFADRAPHAKRITGDVAAKIIDKAFGARPATVEKGKAVLLKLIEIDTADAVCEVVLSQLSNKKPKVPPVCVELLIDALTAFGGRAMPVKQLIAQLPSMFESSNAGVRDKAMSLAVELARWVGTAPLQSTLDSLRSAQQTQFQSLIADIEVGKPPLPTVGLRKDRAKLAQQQQAAAGAATASAGGATEGKVEEVQEAAIDPRDLVEEVNLLSIIRGSEYKRLISESKWNEQMNGLQIIIDGIGPVPKLANDDYGEIMQNLKTFINHSHIQLNTAAIKIVGLFADGLRGGFTTYAKPVTSLIIAKCKEKRLCAQIVESLQPVFKYSMAMDHVQDDLVEHINGTVAKKKVPPHGRVCIIETVEAIAKDAPQQISPACALALVNAMISCLEDSDPKVREAACAALTAFVGFGKRLGRKGSEVLAAIQQLSTKNQRMFAKIMASAGPAGPPVAAAAPAPAPAAAPPAVAAAQTKTAPADSEDKPPTRARPAAAAAAKKRPAPGSTAGRRPVPGAKRAAAGASESKEPVRRPAAAVGGAGAARDEPEEHVGEVTMSPETAAEMMAELGVPGWESSVLPLLASDKWNEKADALKAIENRFKDDGVQAGHYSEALLVFLQSQFNAQLKISNVSLFKAVLECMRGCVVACTADSPFDKRVAAFLITLCADKITDKKLLQLVQEVLGALAEAVRPNFVTRRMMKITESAKAPGAHTAFLEWLSDAVRDFGANMFPVQALVKFCLTEMENKAAQVRTGAITVLGRLYHQIGPPFASLVFAEDMKPQLRSMIEAEFEKVGHDPTAMKNSARQVKDGEVAAVADSGALIPRQDLMNLVGRDIVQRLNNNDGKNAWQVRKTAIEEVVAGVERSSNYLEASKSLAEVLKALRGRLADSQSNLKPLAAAAIAQVVNSVDVAAVPKLLRLVGEALLGGVSDNKKQMRDAAIEAVGKCVTVDGSANTAAVDVLLPALATTLVNPNGRLELLTWFQKVLEVVSVDASELASPLVACMQDKTAATRSAAEACLSGLVARGKVSRNSVEAVVRDLPPAAKRTLEGPVSRMFEGMGGGASAATTEAMAAAPTKAGAESKPTRGAKLGRSQSAATKLRPGAPAREASAARQPAEAKLSASSTASDNEPFKSSGNKQRRQDDFARANWPTPPEEPRDIEFDALREAWTPLLSSSAASTFFPGRSGNMELAVPGAMILRQQLANPVLVQHLDLIFRWLAIHLCERENVKALQALLETINDLFAKLAEEQYLLTDTEATILLPYLVERGGNPKDRFRNLVKTAGALATEIYPANKYVGHLLQGMNSKNSRTKVFCLEEIQRIVPEKGVAALGKRGLRDVVAFVDVRETDVRNAALDALFEVYVQLGSDLGRLFKNTGTISDKARSLIEDRIKEKNKRRDFQPTSSQTTHDEPAAAYQSPVKLSGPYNLDFDSSFESPAPRRQSTVSDEFDVNMNDIFHEVESMLAIEGPFSAEHPVYAAGKEKLKVLHGFITDQEDDRTIFEEVDGGLERYADRIIHLTAKCVHRSFVAAPDSLTDIDTSILSVALAILFAFADDKSIVKKLSDEAMSVIFVSLMSSLTDSRLRESAETDPTLREVVRCMNVVMLRLSLQRPGKSLGCLVRLLLRCVKEGTASEEQLPVPVGQLMMRLMIRITNDELTARKENAFQAEDGKLTELVDALNFFQEKHPSHRPVDDTPFSTVKTITKHLLEAVGHDKVVDAMDEARVSPSARLRRLVERLHEPKQQADVPAEVHSQVVELIRDLPSKMSTEEKFATTQQLHALLQQYPELDIEHYLGSLSEAFQMHVRRMLREVAQHSGAANGVAVDENSAGLSEADALRRRLEAVRRRAVKTDAAPLQPVAATTVNTAVPVARAKPAAPAADPEVDSQVQSLYDRMQRISSRFRSQPKPSSTNTKL